MKRASLLLLLLSVACAPGCTDEADGFEWRGENVTVYGYGYSETSDACAGSLGALDQRIPMLMDYLGISSAPRFEYWWASEEAWEQRPLCQPDAYACAYRTNAFSRRLPDMHEATHMVTYGWGNSEACPHILSEGIAEYFDDPRFARVEPAPELGVVQLIEHDYFPGDKYAYTRALHFVSYLMESHGPEAVAELCRGLPRIDSIADWEAVVPGVLDMSFGALLDDYETYYPLCTSDQLRARLWGCAGTPDFVLISGDPQRRRYVLATDCDDPRTTNAASSDEGGAASTRLVYVPDDNWFTILARAQGPSGHPPRFTVQQCTTCYHQPTTIRSGDPGWLNVENAYYVEAGFYEVTLFFDPRDRAELEIIVGFPY